MTLDLVLAGLVLVFGLFGLRSGAIRQLAHGLGLVAACLGARPLAARLTPAAAPPLGLSPAIVNVLLSALLFCALYALASWAIHRLLANLLPNRQNGSGDKAFGFLLGAGKGGLLLYAALSLLVFFEKPGVPLPPALRGSAAVAFARRRDLFNAVPGPGLAKLETLLAAARNAGGGAGALADQPELRRLLDDPQLKAALQDDALARALKSGDLSALKNDPRLAPLLKDPQFALPAGGPGGESR